MKNFFSEKEIEIGNDFLRDGYRIFKVTDVKALDKIRLKIVTLVASYLGDVVPDDPDDYLNSIHLRVTYKDVNALRLYVFEELNAQPWLREVYFQCAHEFLNHIVGNELVMQRKINLSIQMPGDESSILPVHADTWSGDSPYEVVLWIPFVDVSKTQSMFILPIKENQKHLSRMEKKGMLTTDDIMDEIRADVTWLDMKYGEAIIFTQNIMHGNVLNEESTTRWSTNCRFKSAFSPFADKKLGEFFEPITLRPATLLGANYEFPNFAGHDEQ